MKLVSKFMVTASVGAILVSGIAVPAVAQDVDQSKRSSDNIVVTARKREERLLDVPLSITAFSSDEIEKANIQNIDDFTLMTSNFSFNSLGQRYNDAPIVRGLTSSLGSNGRQAASFFVDGVYVSGSVSSLAFSDIERIEVLKGPQSVLFGRATFAGAVNFVTKDPSNEFEGFLSATYAQFDEHEIVGAVSGPIIQDRLFFRLGARSFGYEGEYVNDLINPETELGGQTTWSVSGSLLATPTDNFRAKLNVTYSQDDDDLAATQLQNGDCFDRGIALFNTVCGEAELDEDGFGLNTSYLEEPGLQRELWRSSLRLDWDVPQHTITSITAYNHEDSTRQFDVDFEPAIIFFGSINGFFDFPVDEDGAQVADIQNYRDFSQEIRISSDFDGPFQYLLGGYYLDLTSSGGRDDGIKSFNPDSRREETNWAVFGSLSYDISSRLHATLEGRYQEAELTIKDGRNAEDPVQLLASGIPSIGKFTKFLPRVTLSYQPTDNSNIYAYWSKGNRPGDFNTHPLTPADRVIVDEENVEAYEIGTKFSLLDGALSVALAGFYMEINDQVSGLVLFIDENTPIGISENIGVQEVKGFEVDANMRFTDGFSVRGSLGYTDSELVAGRSTSAEILLGDAELAGLGNRPALVPEWTGSISASYEKPISGDLTGYLRSDVLYQSSFYGTEANITETGDSVRINLRAGVQTERWTLEVFARNVTDDDTPQRIGRVTRFSVGSSDPNRQTIQLNPTKSRQVGVRANMTF